MDKKIYPTWLADYRVLHEEGEIIIFENNKLKPYDDSTYDYQVMVYDFDSEALFACANWMDDRSLEGIVLLGPGFPFAAVDLEHVVSELLKVEKVVLE